MCVWITKPKPLQAYVPIRKGAFCRFWMYVKSSYHGTDLNDSNCLQIINTPKISPRALYRFLTVFLPFSHRSSPPRRMKWLNEVRWTFITALSVSVFMGIRLSQPWPLPKIMDNQRNPNHILDSLAASSIFDLRGVVAVVTGGGSVSLGLTIVVFVWLKILFCVGHRSHDKHDAHG